jgi:predicted transcriptional regulator
MVRSRDLIELELAHEEVLNVLLSEPKTKPELVEECDVSRTTIDRWINQLEAADLVHRPGDSFELTFFGEVVTLKFNRIRRQLAHLSKLHRPLTNLSTEIDIDPVVFESANVLFYEGLAPEFAEKLLSRPGRVRLLASPTPCVFSIFLYRTPDPDLELEVILDDAVASQLDSYFSSQQLPLFWTATVEVFEIADAPPFCLALVERDDRSVVYFVLEGSQSGLGVIETDAEEALSWGEALYADYRTRASETEWQQFGRPAGLPPDRDQCLVLLEMMLGDVDHETDVLARASGDGEDASSDRRNPLFALDEAGYVDWNRETGELSKGPRFEDVRPLLEVLVDTPENVPVGWW